jgi:hypothetical protein
VTAAASKFSTARKDDGALAITHRELWGSHHLRISGSVSPSADFDEGEQVADLPGIDAQKRWMQKDGRQTLWAMNPARCSRAS